MSTALIKEYWNNAWKRGDSSMLAPMKNGDHKTQTHPHFHHESIFPRKSNQPRDIPSFFFFLLPKSALLGRLHLFYLSDLGLHTCWLWLWVACCTLLCKVKAFGRACTYLCVLQAFARTWTGAGGLWKVTVSGRLCVLLWNWLWTSNGEFATLGTDIWVLGWFPPYALELELRLGVLVTNCAICGLIRALIREFRSWLAEVSLWWLVWNTSEILASFPPRTPLAVFSGCSKGSSTWWGNKVTVNTNDWSVANFQACACAHVHRHMYTKERERSDYKYCVSFWHPSHIAFYVFPPSCKWTNSLLWGPGTNVSKLQQKQ